MLEMDVWAYGKVEVVRRFIKARRGMTIFYIFAGILKPPNGAQEAVLEPYLLQPGSESTATLGEAVGYTDKERTTPEMSLTVREILCDRV